MGEQLELDLGDVNVSTTLTLRGRNYGPFMGNARIAQNIKAAMQDSPNWTLLAADQREALELLATKLSRILNGNANHHDSWHDAGGYTQLIAERLQGNVR